MWAVRNWSQNSKLIPTKSISCETKYEDE